MDVSAYKTCSSQAWRFGSDGNGWIERTTPRPGMVWTYSSVKNTLFFASTYMSLGDGRTAKFVEDRWLQGRSILEIAPQLHDRVLCIGACRERWQMGYTPINGPRTFEE